jgi:uncharacterized protein (DUF488 family)
MKKIYTVGHSQHNIDYFVNMLNTYHINYLIDVRSIPFSLHAPGYNKDILKALLVSHKINYAFMGEYFGARPKNANLYSEKGYLDFDKVKNSKIFLSGIENVLKGIDQGNRIALMCTEKDPIDCHRAILVGSAFYERGIDVDHILANNTLQNHSVLNKRLVNMYFPDRNQISLFHNENLSEKECLKEAYKIQNEKIGYRTVEDEQRISMS